MIGPYDKINEYYSEKYGMKIKFIPFAGAFEPMDSLGVVQVNDYRFDIYDVLHQMGYDGIDEMLDAIVDEVRHKEGNDASQGNHSSDRGSSGIRSLGGPSGTNTVDDGNATDTASG